MGTGTRNITSGTVDCGSSTVDLRGVDEDEVGVFYVSSNNLRNCDPTHNRTSEMASVGARDGVPDGGDECETGRSAGDAIRGGPSGLGSNCGFAEHAASHARTTHT